ncbi:5-methyltetrahydropteroyltriglutamate--homocysteine S-methyltransferase [Corynebacterium macginleyi]|uniref:5-methyltetrahydropteroyltriglutamate-- homocysteine S-methyltransferase n=1 Tax=Corynebacterium macginleyi TaxID=38290 RepID=UPI00190D948E|nr:5-methyltetrahydropteroyltriglutamate--homocysteine S-methyltransferase [Corynebacterium macginleyi]MBK4139326.1 5-methyltetrahydropteroyltriglutamate--homocysteine S-methyltransferase [Corynebacterium macginleyi]MBK4144103.1 5-methyltetrahydropteroyltriglutamate--homocysteine S-methyltransferase [Corynebacterium macginleyi]MBK4149528.1 5-methyltetrahydropteroyltriglutamate--homocysteine S-methyltransferase [Corynebacterium macginleyi]MBK4153089.1 5-methyltetrahydropteroyltriglutamate--homoc
MTNANFPKATVEGYPRIGANRELKRALESYWAGRIDAQTFESAAHSLRLDTYHRLRDLGLTEDYAIPADVAYYDQVLETALTVGAVAGETLDDEFTLARGNKDTAPLEMTKWFDTNYHYIVPEIADEHAFKAHPQRIIKLVEEAREAGHTVRPYLVGPVTLLALSKQAEGAAKAPLERLDDAVAAYQEVLAELHQAGVEWIQLAEPALVADLANASDEDLAAYTQQAYSAILGAEKRPQVYLTTPYGSARKGLDVIAELKPEAVQVDLAVGTLALDEGYLERVKNLNTHVVAGLVDGRNVWAANLRDLRSKYENLAGSIDELSVSTSVSLQHVPHSVAAESKLPADVAPWFSFANEKVKEVVALVQGPEAAEEAYSVSDRAVRTRAESERINNAAVQERISQLPEGEVKRAPAFNERKEAQKELGLSELPTTTIGSFPQTKEIRQARAAHRKGELSDADYNSALKDEVKSVIELQERLGLDVLVHGEPERNDMVQYFAELLDGFVTTENGWVQSYGSRCTRPPIVVGDISRPAAMTIEWSKFAQSLSEKHVKGMLTGPVTILAWSFVRDDVHQSVSADQLGVALADEVRDLEEAGIDIIQIDEPALRELLPLREQDRKAYLDWAVRSFRLVALEAKPTTQIHTHLCYSEFGQIIDAVAGLDADVTSIEAARSRMELLEDIDDTFHSEIGPGIYDIHSPRVPSVEEMAELIRAALKNVPLDRLWVNPDCGLKTRGYEETETSLRNMVEARDVVRNAL